MGGKWPMLAVLGVGLVASLCAAVLMAAMRGGAGSTQEVETRLVEVIVATRDLPSMTRLEQDMIEVRQIDAGDRPEGSFREPVQVLGRVIKSPLVAGQPVSAAVLLSEDAGARLASSLPPGFRAVSVELNASSAMRGLLYPGSRVDVIAAFRAAPGRQPAGSPVSRTLLQNVSVLAVEDRTLFTPDEEKSEEEIRAQTNRQPVRRLMVTLMVDPQQARELQAARDLGELSLSLRNPNDDTLTDDPAGMPAEPLLTESDEPEGPWQIRVIRGSSVEVHTFNEQGKLETQGERVADVPTEPPLEYDE